MLYKSKLDSSKLTMTAFSFLLYTPLQEYTQVGSKLYLRIRLIKKDLLLIRNTHLLSVNSLSGILNDIINSGLFYPDGDEKRMSASEAVSLFKTADMK